MRSRFCTDTATLEGRDTAKLIICPDGVLNYVPFEIFACDSKPCSNWKDVAFLNHRVEVTYEPSALALISAREHQRDGVLRRELLAFGDARYSPHELEVSTLGEVIHVAREVLSNNVGQTIVFGSLPFSLVELDAIRRILKVPSLTESNGFFTGTAATKGAVFDASQRRAPDVLHFACHGIVADASVENGALLLSPEDPKEVTTGVLTAAEIMSHRIGARLVVLSACQTALGALSRGEGVQGLTRAWQFAGAEAVIASLWSVDDEAAATLMSAFYEALFRSGGTVVESLAAARRAVMSEPLTAHPYYWAPFVLWGRADLSVAST